MTATRLDVHQLITNQIIAAIESGAGEFKLLWHRSGADLSQPRNIASQSFYRGINVLTLWLTAEAKAYPSGLWGTFNQWTALGAKIRKGEKASLVVFYKETIPSKIDETVDKKSCHIARATPVFALEQVEDYAHEIAVLELDSSHNINCEAEAFIKKTGAVILHGGSAAYYQPSTDRIHLPVKNVFIGSESSSAEESYYATVFHELIHFTGRTDRCDRDLSGRFGTSAYAMEELIAELGAAFLCSHFKISSAPRKDHAQYLANWLSVMKSDKRAIFSAASQASRAVDFLLDNRGS